VPAGFVLEVWMGFDHKYTDRDLQQHDRGQWIGIFVFPDAFRDRNERSESASHELGCDGTRLRSSIFPDLPRNTFLGTKH
jgi:hypothetical protein